MKVGSYEVPSLYLKIGVPVLIVLMLILFIYVPYNSAHNEAVQRQTELNAQYQANQNELGTYISTFYETLGVANLKSQKLDTILTDAVKGRYEGHTSAQPGTGQLFSAISEAYPDLAALDVYDKIVDYIQAGREDYKDTQNKLLDMLRDFDAWRKTGLISQALVKHRYPNDDLVARIGTALPLRGRAAEDQMYLIVLPSQAAEAYQNGTLDPLEIPTDKPLTSVPSPSAS